MGLGVRDSLAVPDAVNDLVKLPLWLWLAVAVCERDTDCEAVCDKDDVALCVKLGLPVMLVD